LTVSPISGQVDLAWRKASLSHAANNCVELALKDGMVVLRHSKSPDGPVIAYTAEEFYAFLDGAKKGEFDDLC
jgi:hypothetical protein